MLCGMNRCYLRYTVHVALAGQTGGAIRVVLDLFVSSERSRRIASRQKEKKEKKLRYQYISISTSIISIGLLPSCINTALQR